jgi:hypothetical protein
MPTYRFQLMRPVVYQPDHPIARREITELDVRANDEAMALSHLHRSTRGVVCVASVTVVKC